MGRTYKLKFNKGSNSCDCVHDDVDEKTDREKRPERNHGHRLLILLAAAVSNKRRDDTIDSFVACIVFVYYSI